jgi:hypothetical protein
VVQWPQIDYDGLHMKPSWIQILLTVGGLLIGLTINVGVKINTLDNLSDKMSDLKTQVAGLSERVRIANDNTIDTSATQKARQSELESRVDKLETKVDSLIQLRSTK